MQTEIMTLNDFKALDIQRLGYAKKLKEFVNNQDEVLKFSLESGAKARSCSSAIRNIIRKMGVNYKVVNRGLEVYVVKEA